MKSKGYVLFLRILVVLMMGSSVAACHTIQHESALEWMQRQPVGTDP